MAGISTLDSPRQLKSSWASFVPTVEAAEELVDFVGHPEAKEVRHTVVVQPELGRERQHQAVRRAPVDGRAEIVGRLARAKAIAFSQSAVHLDTGLEFLSAERAVVRLGHQRERTADAPCVAELPRAASKVFFHDEVFADVPAFVVATEDQLEFDLALLFCPRLTVGVNQIFLTIVADDFEKRLVGAVDVLK